MTDVLTAPPQTVLHTGTVDDSPPPRRSREPVRIGFARALLGVPLACLWIVAYLAVFSGFEQGHTQHVLYDEVRTTFALGEGPTGAPIAVGDPVALVSVPDLDISNLVVVEGTRNAELQDGVGHETGTVLPGQQGVSTVVGKSFTFGAPFRELHELRPGAAIRVTNGQGSFTYAVTGLRVKGDPIPAPPQAGEGQLRLVTSLRSTGLLGGLRPATTMYVDAELEKAAPAGAVAPADPGTSYMTGKLTVSTLAQLALALQVVLIVLAAVTWAWKRWSPRAAWIVALPTLGAALWVASSLASLVLPGLI